MSKYIFPLILALLTLTGAIIEGLVEGLSPQIVQINGLLTILCAGAFITWTLKLQAGGFRKH